jgi:hypothetical protein
MVLVKVGFIPNENGIYTKLKHLTHLFWALGLIV